MSHVKKNLRKLYEDPIGHFLIQIKYVAVSGRSGNVTFLFVISVLLRFKYFIYSHFTYSPNMNQ